MESLRFLIVVLWSPSEVFKQLSERPRVLAPLVLLTILAISTTAAVFTRIDPGDLAMRNLEMSGRAASLTEQQKERIRTQSRSSGLMAIGVASAAVGPVVVIVVVGSAFFGVLTLVGRQGTYKAFLAVTAFAFVPTVFRQLAATAMVLALTPSTIFPEDLGGIGLAAFVDRASVSRTAYVAAGLVDLISLWVLVLLIIGYGHLCRPKASKVVLAASVFGLWAVYAGLRVAMAAFVGF